MNKKSYNHSERIHLRDEYIARINRVMDYIEENLADELTLNVLADVADFSRFHFHRIFSSMVGETLNHFIQRIRVEKAAAQLIVNPKKSITDVAFDCGFSGSSTFARYFKEAFKVSPSQWRQQVRDGGRKIRIADRNNGKIPRNIRKDLYISSCYTDGEHRNLIWRIKMKETNVKKDLQVKVEVRELPEMHVAYVRHIGPYKGDEELFKGLFTKLMTWAGPRGLLGKTDQKCMSVYHDNPEITEENKLRLSVCITVPEDTQVEGEIGKMTIAGGKYAMARFEIDTDQYEQAWAMVYGGWLPESGYQPDDRPCFELYLNDPNEHPEHKHILDICAPVKPL